MKRKPRFPREALVFRFKPTGYIWEGADVFCGYLIARKAEFTGHFDAFFKLEEYTPLTPAARDFLANVKKGMR